MITIAFEDDDGNVNCPSCGSYDKSEQETKTIKDSWGHEVTITTYMCVKCFSNFKIKKED